MSACDRPVEALLTAELDELAGKADTELGRHVRDCPHCSAAARKILAANAALNESLTRGWQPLSGPLIARARSRKRGAGRPSWSVQWAVGGTRLVWGAVAISVLAVWITLVAVVIRHDRLPDSESVTERIAAERTAEPPLVEAPGYNVAVVPTANPAITIVWFSKENDDADAVDAIRDGPIAVDPARGL
ncbi:MAG: hypothetical protein OXQ90_03600 [Gammaproteobacteria bacterium]|nr:hypothetical protein [Gammaproteobacteria bacterium]